MQYVGAINLQPPHTTWKDQLCFSLQPGHYSSLTAPNLQPTANQDMYNFRFTILINTNNTSNYHSTNETHYIQQNTTINTHKRSQQLILTETRYQLQPSDKELHTEHTPLRTFSIFTERNDQCDNQHYSRELLMMGIVVPETCWAYRKYNKIISGT